LSPLHMMSWYYLGRFSVGGEAYLESKAQEASTADYSESFDCGHVDRYIGNCRFLAWELRISASQGGGRANLAASLSHEFALPFNFLLEAGDQSVDYHFNSFAIA